MAVGQGNAPTRRTIGGLTMKTKIDGRKIRMTFETTDPTLSTLVFDASRVHSAQHEAAEMYGWQVRLTRAAALSRTGADGKVVTVTEEMRRAEVAALVEHYHGGSTDWNMRATGKAAAQNPVIAAIAAKLGIDYEAAQAKVAEQFLADLAG